MQQFLSVILSIIARGYLWRYHPQVVAVTGNAGKTSTKDAIAAVLRTRYSVRATGGNLNNELGIPTTIIGDFARQYYATGGTVGFWFSVLWHGIVGLFQAHPYPQILVLEYGADRPGDIRRLARWFAPDVAVVTRIGEVPVHIEFFASAQHLAEEKSHIVRALKPNGYAVLNADDMTVLDMREHTRAHVRTFGFGEGALVRAGDVAVRYDGSSPTGIGYTLHINNIAMPVVLRGTIGRGAVAATAAAVATGQIFDVGLADAVEAFSRMEPVPGRMRILPGIKGATLIDDTYNASPAAMHLAIDAVRELAGRKVLVVGDMLELGAHSVSAHQAVGTMAASVADELICIGERARVMADAARNQLSPDRVHWYENSRVAAPEVQKMVREGDLVLVKGSQGMRMERIVKEIMAEPDRAGELLVRQSSRWLTK